MNHFGVCLLWAAIQCTLLAAVAMIISSRPWRMGGALAPLVALLAIALVTVLSFVPKPQWWPSLEYSLRNPTTAESTNPTPATSATDSTPTDMQASTAASPDVVNDDAPIASEPTASALAILWLEELQRATTVPTATWSQSWLPLLAVWIFAIGTAVGLSRLLIGLWGAADLRKRSHLIDAPELRALIHALNAQLGLTIPIEVRQCDLISTAATVGVWKPVVLLPADWSSWQPGELRAVLAHELTHILHGDFLAQLLAQVGIVLHFYNPIVHWLSLRLKLEQELAADAVAARLVGGQRQYLRVLATLILNQQTQTVGWPARAFLPTRQTFLRRLEMLRASNSCHVNRTTLGRLGALAVIGLAALALLAIRPGPGQATAQVPTAQSLKAQAAAATSAFELQYIDETATVVLGIHPNAILAQAPLRELQQRFGAKLDEELKESLGVGVNDIAQVVVGLNPHGRNQMMVHATFLKPIKLNSSKLGTSTIKIQDRDVLEIPNRGWLWQPSDNSLVFNQRESIERYISGRSSQHQVISTNMWAKLKDQHSFVLVEGQSAREAVQSSTSQSAPIVGEPAILLAKSLLADTAWLGAGASVDGDLQLKLVAQCKDTNSAQEVSEVTTAGLRLIKWTLKEKLQALETQPLPGADVNDQPDVVRPSAIVNQLEQLATKLLSSAVPEVQGDLIQLQFKTSLDQLNLGNVFGIADAAASRNNSANNLKQLGLAMHLYHEAHKHFPPASGYRHSDQDTARKYPFSWRVAILPFIERKDLYDLYNFDEPWDSPNNLKLLAKMPAVFRHPSAPNDSTTTSYAAVTGKETMFPLDKGMPIRSITDGTSNTLMLVEADTKIPWTKPEDLAYSADGPLPNFGGYSPNGYNVVLCNGAVRFFASSIDEQLLRNLITARGGEVIPQ